jgi:uncharacterized protein
MHWLYYVLLAIVMLVGLAVTLIGAPGLWIMLLALVLYAWVTHFAIVAWPGIIAVFTLCAFAEIVEFVFGGLGAKRAGASARAIFGAILGGLLGGIFLTFLIPIPVIGTIIGVCAGSFLGAMLLEFSREGEVAKSMRVGVGAAKGRFIGLVSKLMFGVIILLTSLILAFPR